MKIRLVDGPNWIKFAPLSLTRPVSELRTGFFTNTQRYKAFLPYVEISFETEKYLQNVYKNSTENAIIIPSNIIPNTDFVIALSSLKVGERLYLNNILLASYGTNFTDSQEELRIEFLGDTPIILEERWQLFEKNEAICKQDFELLTLNKSSAKISETNTIIGDKSKIFLEENAKIEASILNTNEGYIYLAKNSEIMEGCLIRGSLMMQESAQLKMGTKVYGANSIGPFCKVGGEINNVIFQGYSNKGHDGFLGNSLIGEWCNLGADTNTSNLKNNYGKVKTYSYENVKEIQTDVTFMGLTMGDHSKCGINTMFNTASVVGVSSVLFSGGFFSKHIPSFSWGENEKYNFEKAIIDIESMMQRRGEKLSPEQIKVLRFIFDNY